MAKASMSKQQFINQWLRHFAKDLTKEQRTKYIQDQYIWHAFSWNLVDTANLLEGNTARQAFNKVSNQDCICCDMFGNNGILDKLPSEYTTAEKIDEFFAEFYVVAKDYSWTYIKTHEGEQFGPYFFVIE